MCIIFILSGNLQSLISLTFAVKGCMVALSKTKLYMEYSQFNNFFFFPNQIKGKKNIRISKIKLKKMEVLSVSSKVILFSTRATKREFCNCLILLLFF